MTQRQNSAKEKSFLRVFEFFFKKEFSVLDREWVNVKEVRNDGPTSCVKQEPRERWGSSLVPNLAASPACLWRAVLTSTYLVWRLSDFLSILASILYDRFWYLKSALWQKVCAWCKGLCICYRHLVSSGNKITYEGSQKLHLLRGMSCRCGEGRIA